MYIYTYNFYFFDCLLLHPRHNHCTHIKGMILLLFKFCHNHIPIFLFRLQPLGYYFYPYIQRFKCPFFVFVLRQKAGSFIERNLLISCLALLFLSMILSWFLAALTNDSFLYRKVPMYIYPGRRTNMIFCLFVRLPRPIILKCQVLILFVMSLLISIIYIFVSFLIFLRLARYFSILISSET